jgi:drug/metabolite transporter (DMT)-like permease
MWLLYALLAGGFYTVNGLMSRYVLRGQKDAWAFSFFFSLVGAVISLPFMLASPELPHAWWPWMMAVVVGCILVGHNWLTFSASKYLESSLAGSIAKIRLIWVFVLGILVLHEPATWLRSLGVLCTVAAGVVIIHRTRRSQSFKGVGLLLGSTISYALMILIYKQLFHYFNTASLTFFVTFVPAAILNFAIMPRAIPRIAGLYKTDGYKVLAGCAVGAFANLAMNAALSTGNSSSVTVIIEAFLVITLIGEHVVLKEKEQLWTKLVAVCLAIAGAVLIQIG